MLLAGIFGGAFVLLRHPQYSRHAQRGEFRPPVEDLRYGDHLLRVTHSQEDSGIGEDHLVVFYAGKQVYEKRSYYLRLLPDICEDQRTGLRNATDIDRDGIVDFIVNEHTGGSMWGRYWHLLHLRKGKVEEVLTLNQGRLNDCAFQDIDNDGRAEVFVSDQSFVDWGLANADALWFGLWFRLRGDELVFDPALNRKPIRPLGELLKETAGSDWSHGLGSYGWLPPQAFDYVLVDLATTGHLDAISTFAHRAGPSSIAGREEHLDRFRSNLSEPLRILNGIGKSRQVRLRNEERVAGEREVFLAADQDP